MKALKNIVLGSRESDLKHLTIHLVIKAVIVVGVLLLMWGLEYQAAVIYEAF